MNCPSCKQEIPWGYEHYLDPHDRFKHKERRVGGCGSYFTVQFFGDQSPLDANARRMLEDVMITVTKP